MISSSKSTNGQWEGREKDQKTRYKDNDGATVVIIYVRWKDRVREEWQKKKKKEYLYIIIIRTNLSFNWIQRGPPCVIQLCLVIFGYFFPVQIFIDATPFWVYTRKMTMRDRIIIIYYIISYYTPIWQYCTIYIRVDGRRPNLIPTRRTPRVFKK